MTIILRRFLVVMALLYWQGGFLFYSAAVVPIGQDMLGVTQGFITRRVTVALNVAGAVAVVPLLLDALLSGEPRRGRRVLRLFCWAIIAITLVLLFWMHPRLDDYLDVERHIVENARAFRRWHRWYLWISTIQWALGLVYMVLMLQAWRAEDGRVNAPV